MTVPMPMARTTRTPGPNAAAPTATQFLETLAGMRTAIVITTPDGRALALSEALGHAVDAMTHCTHDGHKLIFIGNGGSAGIASHQAVDYWKNGGMEALAFNDASLLTCIGNDYGYEQVFAQPIRRFVKAGDLLIAISSSGRSPNILNGVAAARDMGCSSITLSGFDETNPLRRLGAFNFYVPSHGYGVVEVSHLALLHAMLEEAIARRQPAAEAGA